MTTNVMRRSLAALTLIVVAAACGSKDAGPAEDGREIELAPAAADAPLNDQAPTPPASAPTTAPAATKAPAPSRPSTSSASSASSRGASLAAGTAITVASADRICTNTHKVGDRFTAAVTADVAGSNGTLAAGTPVTLEVVESARGENSQERVKLAFKVVSIEVAGQTRALAADITQVAKLDYVRVQSTGTQAGKVATGAAIGAVAGQLLGKDTKSTVAGAAVGAVAGGAVAAATTDYNGCLPANGPITVTLSEQMNLR